MSPKCNDETSLIPSCPNSFELSPPITAKKRPKPRKIDSNSMHEHSLGISLFDSPISDYNHCKISNGSLNFDNSGITLFGSPSVVSFTSKQPNAKKNDTKTRNSINETSTETVNICNVSESNTHDELLLSPPMTATKRTSRSKISKMLSQSTPIVTRKQTTNIPKPFLYSPVNEESKNPLNQPPSKKSKNEEECLLDDLLGFTSNVLRTKSTSDEELSPTIAKLDNAMNVFNFTNETKDKLDLSLSVTAANHETKDNNTLDLSPPVTTPIDLLESKQFETNANKCEDSFDKDQINISELPLQFELKTHQKTNNFLYPKLSKRKDSECLDSVSIVKIKSQAKKRVSSPNSNPQAPGDKSTKQSSFIDMDDLSQIPFDLIKSPSPLKNDSSSNCLINNNIEILPFCKAECTENNLNNFYSKSNETIEFQDKSNVKAIFSGFQTAKGTAVNVSESALKAAKQKFESDEVLVNNEKTPSFTGFKRPRELL